MKQHKTQLAVFAVVVAGLVTFPMLFAVGGLGQSQAGARSATTAAVAQPLVVERRTDDDAAAAPEKKDTSLFAEAAARNTALKYELGWTFGGKQQRGWHLYTQLISRTLETDGEAAGPEFASALSRWQKRSGLRPSGVLDGETLYRMVSEWQGARLKNKGRARAEDLLLAPTTDLYDPSRRVVLRPVVR